MHISQDLTKIIIPYQEGIASIIPHGKRFAFQGQDMFVMPNEQIEAKIARNLGVMVPAPILTRYDWRGTKPWDIQRTTAAMLTECERAYVLNGLGTGKTRSVLYAYDFLERSGALSGPMLISAPLSVVSFVWEREIFNVMATRKVSVLYGDRKKRLRKLAEKADIYIINHHGMDIILDELIKKKFGIFVIDELAILRNKSTDLWRAANAIVQSLAPSMGAASKPGYAWGLTGYPTPQAPTDAWAQCRLLTPATVPRTKAQFIDMTMRRVTQFKWVARPDAMEIVHKAMQPSVRFTIQDVMELPPTVYLDKIVKLDPPAKLAYDRLWKKAKIVSDQGKNITAVNEGVLHNKLMQVAAGYIYADDRTIYELPHQGRLDALLETVEEAEGKVIVFVTYKHALAGIAGFLRGAGYTVGVVSGDVPSTARNAIFRGFQDGSTPRIICAHPACMAHGLTLTAADTIIWYCPTQSLETYDQGNHRIIRPSQTRRTRVVHLFGTVVERVTYNRLKQRANMQGALLEMFAAQELIF